MRVQTFTLKGIDVDVMYNKGSLAYIFKKEGKEYGNAVKLKDKSIESIVASTFLLLSNALETYDKLNENIGAGKDAQRA